jgi:hypothetical protein
MPVGSVDDAFRELLSRIELSPLRVRLASQRYNAMKASIEGALPGRTVRQIGSFPRGTKIRPADLSDQLDIEVLVSFGPFSHSSAPDKEGFTPSRVLQILRLAIRSNDAYRVLPQQQDQPTVRVEYPDQMAIELLPAFEDPRWRHYQGPDRPNCYVVGSSLYTWIAADYDYDTQIISGLDAQAEEKLVPTIKLVKAYFRNASVPLKSFHTEILVANILPSLVSEWKGYRYGYHHLLAGFLSEVSKTITSAAVLRGSFSQPVDSGLSYAALSSLATFMAARAEVAWQLCSADTIRGWTEFFGEPFPTGASRGAF